MIIPRKLHVALCPTRHFSPNNGRQNTTAAVIRLHWDLFKHSGCLLEAWKILLGTKLAALHVPNSEHSHCIHIDMKAIISCGRLPLPENTLGLARQTIRLLVYLCNSVSFLSLQAFPPNEHLQLPKCQYSLLQAQGDFHMVNPQSICILQGCTLPAPSGGSFAGPSQRL